MIELLKKEDRKARKEHTCNLCCGKIKPGEVYEWSKNIYDGTFYEWREHKKCSFIAAEIWCYADPDEGMDEDLFAETVRDVCQNFVCPDCEKWDAEISDCEDDKFYCLDRVYKFFQTHELYKKERKSWGEIWACREKNQT